MSVAGVIGLFRASPQEPAGEDGRMALADHLRELRARLLRVVLFLIIATVVAFFFYNQLFELILKPYNDARKMLGTSVTSKPVITGAAGPFLLQLKICGLTGLVVTSPYWLYEIWAFIVPGLHRNERRWTRAFLFTAGPLFLAGVVIGYYVLPKGLQVLLSFTPSSVTSLVEFGEYFSFFTRMLLVFGVAFEIPLFVLLLNLAGVVSGQQIGRARPWIVVGRMVFAAVATPSTDPFSMLMLGIPMLILFALSEIAARVLDRIRHKGAHRPDRTDQWADDQASPL
jgi:sec-independent protein translocase protein TatC